MGKLGHGAGRCLARKRLRVWCQRSILPQVWGGGFNRCPQEARQASLMVSYFQGWRHALVGIGTSRSVPRRLLIGADGSRRQAPQISDDCDRLDLD